MLKLEKKEENQCLASKAGSCFQAGSQACNCWTPCEGILNVFHNLDQKKIVVNANQAPTGEETCSLEKARGCLGLVCAHYECFLQSF